MNKILCIIMALCLASCQNFFYQEADADKLIDTSKKIAVNCIISNDTDLIEAQVVWMNSVFEDDFFGSENTFEPIADASVVIKSGNQTLKLLYNAGNERFEAVPHSFSLVPGQVYILEVLAKGQTVRASCTFPNAPKQISGYVSITPNANTPYADVDVNLTWYDTLFAKYYQASTELVSRNGDSYGQDYEGGNCGLFGPSKRADGKHVERLSFLDRYIEDSSNLYAIVQIFACDENLYRYQKSLCNYNTGDPFSEATIVHSNIEGGMGIFGAYLVTEMVVE